MDEMQNEIHTTINAPWTNGDEVFTGMLGFIKQAKDQLLYFQKKGDTPALQKDIAGYDEILKSGREANARVFMEFKDEARRNLSKTYANNLLIVQAMKDQGKWKDKEVI